MSKGKEFLSQLKMYSDYMKWLDDEGRYETWEEACQTVLNTHVLKYGKRVNKYVDEILPFYQNRDMLVSQRNLQFRGKHVLKHNPRVYNCLGRDTTFITHEGVKSFFDFEDGDETFVLTHNGNWKKAVIRSYGMQQLYNIKFSLQGGECEVRATKDHRWILSDGKETT